MQELGIIYGHLDSYNTYATSVPFAAPNGGGPNPMAGEIPMGILVHQTAFSETWVAPDGKDGLWVNHVTLAPPEH